MFGRLEAKLWTRGRLLCRNMSFMEDSVDILRSLVQRRKAFHIPRDHVLYGHFEDDYGHIHAANLDNSFSKVKYFDDEYYKGSSYCSLETLQERDGEILRIRGKLQRFASDNNEDHASQSTSNNKSYVRPTRKCYCAVKVCCGLSPDTPVDLS
jgi:hypothetical protein